MKLLDIGLIKKKYKKGVCKQMAENNLEGIRVIEDRFGH